MGALTCGTPWSLLYVCGTKYGESFMMVRNLSLEPSQPSSDSKSNWSCCTPYESSVSCALVPWCVALSAPPHARPSANDPELQSTSPCESRVG